jgi:septum formation protein
MTSTIILASSSQARITMFRNAGLDFEAIPARTDEEALTKALQAEKTRPRDISDALAEAKAKKISAKHPENLVIGSDQVLELDGDIFQKPQDRSDLEDQMRRLSGKTHVLHSAAVIYHECQPIWRQVGTVKMTMRALDQSTIAAYVSTYWEEIRHCVGGYRIEAEGIRLFSQIDGDYFHVLGFPLLETLNYLHLRGHIS